MIIKNNEQWKEVILVEDDSRVISVIESALKSVDNKADLVSFSEADQFINYLNTKSTGGSDSADLMMINLYSSGKSNEGLIQKLKSSDKWKRIPIIALDNSPVLIKARKIYDLKVNCYLVKPGGSQELLDCMQTTFSFWLNIVRLATCPQMSADKISCNSGPEQTHPGDYEFSGKADVLLVEDNPGDVRLTREALVDSGFQCNLHVFSNGADALDFLNHKKSRHSAILPDIIFLDLNLPRMDGREVLSVIKSSGDFRHIPVFILTTSANEKDIKQAYDLHANCYILKPLDMDQCINIFYCLKRFWFFEAVLP